MGTVAFELSKTLWKRITDAGTEGTCWKKTAGQVVIDHTVDEGADTLPTSNTNVTVAKSKRVPQDKDNGEVLIIPADDVNDVYYALSLGGDNEKIVVDTV